MGPATSDTVVVAGLDPAIRRSRRSPDGLMDARIKPAHDGPEVGNAP
jgi:hypothetical protein